MENKNILEQILKRQDKILNLLTRIAKTLNLIPATPKEHASIQRTIAENIKNNAKAYTTTEAMKTPNEDMFKTYLEKDFSFDKESLYGDVIGQDLLGGDS